MSQRFYAGIPESFTNGAIGWYSGRLRDCLGPFAKVQNCPVKGLDRRYTCYATGYADTVFSVPAETRVRGKRITGFFSMEDGGVFFTPHIDELAKLPPTT